MTCDSGVAYVAYVEAVIPKHLTTIDNSRTAHMRGTADLDDLNDTIT